MKFTIIFSVLFLLAQQSLADGDFKPSNSSSHQEIVKSVRRSDSNDKPKINVLELISGVGKALHIILNQNQTQTLTVKDNGPTNGNLTVEERGARQKEDYRNRAEELRVEIAKRASQLQQIVVSAIDIMKDRGDVMFRRVLEHLNSRLEQAKNSADKILKEPATSEMAIRTLNTINQGLNSITTHIHNLLNRVNIRINVDLKKDNAKTN